MIQSHRGDWQHRDAILADQERIFIGAMEGAAIFDDAQTARGDLVDDKVIEEDDTISDVFLQAVTGEGAFASFAGDNGSNLFIFEPAEEAAEFSAQDALVRQGSEESFDGIQNDTFGANGLDGVVEADEEAFQIILAGFLNFT